MKVLVSALIFGILLVSCSNNANDNEENAASYEAATVLKTGQKVPAFSLTTLSGELINIDSLKGKSIFLNFFTLSCPMCMKELPQLEKQIWNVYKDREDFVILTIGREHKNDELQKFYDKKQFTFPMAGDTDRSVYAIFAEKFVPRNIIINKEGNLVYTGVGYNDEEGLTDVISAIKKELGE